MPGAQTVTVDGVEPSILVSLLDIPDNPGRVKVYTADDGTDRYLVKGGEPTLLTPKDLGVLGIVSYEILKAETEPETVVIPSPPAPKPAQEPSSPINPPGLPGQ